MKIRLGNDIRLKIQLPVDSITGNKANILSARAFFVNTTLEEELKKKYIKKNRFIGRFPIEPFVDEYEPTPYNINCSGYPKYRAFVHNEYKGFGYKPDWKECAPIRDVNITRYESAIEYTSERETIIVEFPAEAQMYEGTYELIITALIYDQGYSNNSRTVTIDSKNLFELVKETSEEEDLDHPVFLDINQSDSNTLRDDIYVVGGTYNNDNISIIRNDNARINVDVSPVSGWYYNEQ